MKEEVFVYIYDLSRGLAKSMSQMLIGKQLEGIWHTGIVVFGREFYFGGEGISSCPPCGTIIGQPDKIHSLGTTEVTHELFMDYLNELSSSTFRPECYHLLDHNCNTFSDETANFLCGQSIPSYITNLPKDVLDTPFGAMIRPMIDSMSVNPSGGERLFPSAQPSASSNGRGAAAKQSASQQKPSAAPTTNNVQTSATDSNQKKVPSAVTHKAKNLECSGSLISLLTPQQAQLLQDARDYVHVTDDSWSLTPQHVHTIVSSIKSEVMSHEHKRYLLDLLLSLTHKPDFIIVLCHDSDNSLMSLVHSYTQSPQTDSNSELCSVLAKLVCNVCSTQEGHDLCTKSEDNANTVTTFCCDQLLSTDHASAVDLAYNYTRLQLTDDLYIQLGSALAELVNRKPAEQCAQKCLTSLDRCMRNSMQFTALAAVLELDISQWQEKEPELCQSILQQLKQATDM